MPLGNRSGPTKADIIALMPAEFYGATPAELATDVDELISEERSSVIDPVHVNGRGQIYIPVRSPDNTSQPLFINRDRFSGTILAIIDGEKEPRQVDVATLSSEPVYVLNR